MLRSKTLRYNTIMYAVRNRGRGKILRSMKSTIINHNQIARGITETSASYF